MLAIKIQISVAKFAGVDLYTIRIIYTGKYGISKQPWTYISNITTTESMNWIKCNDTESFSKLIVFGKRNCFEVWAVLTIYRYTVFPDVFKPPCSQRKITLGVRLGSIPLTVTLYIFIQSKFQCALNFPLCFLVKSFLQSYKYWSVSLTRHLVVQSYVIVYIFESQTLNFCLSQYWGD